VGVFIEFVKEYPDQLTNTFLKRWHNAAARVATRGTPDQN
jgi:hypothetical protein